MSPGFIAVSIASKLYGASDEVDERRYSPAVCTGARVEYIEGNPDPAKISTSYVERQNLTMRMGMRRFTRLTNAFSKRVENLASAVALHFQFYNFARPHSPIRRRRFYLRRTERRFAFGRRSLGESSSG